MVRMIWGLRAIWGMGIIWGIYGNAWATLENSAPKDPLSHWKAHRQEIAQRILSQEEEQAIRHREGLPESMSSRNVKLFYENRVLAKIAGIRHRQARERAYKLHPKPEASLARGLATRLLLKGQSLERAQRLSSAEIEFYEKYQEYLKVRLPLIELPSAEQKKIQRELREISQRHQLAWNETSLDLPNSLECCKQSCLGSCPANHRIVCENRLKKPNVPAPQTLDLYHSPSKFWP